ncbi:PTS sugar transporter subunit IIA [Oenococcus oeni]
MTKLNIILATHGQFGAELVKSAEMIVGKTEDVYSLSLIPGESFEEFTHVAINLLNKLTKPSLALVDLFGGTPSNVLTALTRKYNLEVVTGLNLPQFIKMYLKVSSNNNEFDIRDSVSVAIETVRKSAISTNDQFK